MLRDHRAALLAAGILAMAPAAGCGSEDAPSGDRSSGESKPAAAAAQPRSSLDGVYEMELSREAARRVPDPAIRAGTYVLAIERGRYSIVSPQNGPYNRGEVTIDGRQVRFGADEGEQCPESGRYTLEAGSGVIRLRAVSDGCPGRRAFIDQRRWQTR